MSSDLNLNLSFLLPKVFLTECEMNEGPVWDINIDTYIQRYIHTFTDRHSYIHTCMHTNNSQDLQDAICHHIEFQVPSRHLSRCASGRGGLGRESDVLKSDATFWNAIFIHVHISLQDYKNSMDVWGELWHEVTWFDRKLEVGMLNSSHKLRSGHLKLHFEGACVHDIICFFYVHVYMGTLLTVKSILSMLDEQGLLSLLGTQLNH